MVLERTNINSRSLGLTYLFHDMYDIWYKLFRKAKVGRRDEHVCWNNKSFRSSIINKRKKSCNILAIELSEMQLMRFTLQPKWFPSSPIFCNFVQ